MSSKAGRTDTGIDLIKELGIQKRKLFGMARKKQSALSAPSSVGSNGGGIVTGSPGANGINGESGLNGNILLRQILPQSHTNDTLDGIPVGWCPNGARTQFLIQDAQVFSNSVVAINASSANGSDNYADRTSIKVQLINYTDGTYSGFLIICDIAPVSTDKLNYAIFNIPVTKNVIGHDGGATGGGFYNDGGTTNTLSTGTVHAMKIGNQEGLRKDGTVISVGIRVGAAGGKVRFKIYQDAVSCGVVPFSFPGTLLAETDSVSLLSGWNDVGVSVVIPHDAYYNGAGGCGANNPNAGAVWIGIEVDSSVPVGYFPTSPFFGYTYVHSHTYNPGSPTFNYPTDIATDAYNVRLNWVEVIS